MWAARSTRLGLAGLLFAAAAVVWAGQPGGLELTVTPVGGGEPLFLAPLEPGERFTLRYVHSVDRQPVWEEHSADARGRIFIEEERLVMFGAGMGELPGRGRLGGRGNLQVIEDMHDLLGEFVLRVGSVGVDHTLVWRGTETNLSATAAGRAVRVAARPVTRFTRWWRGWFPHPATPRPGADHG